MLKMYPFPIIRNERTDPDLTKLVLSLLKQADLKVTSSSDGYCGYLITKEGTLTFWNQNYPYAYAHRGSFKDSAGVVKEWCGCGNVMDRDLNAAINLKNKAVSSTVTACGEDGSGRGGNIATKPASVKQEDLSTSC